jgi:steroid delta-isomerase-like uncharacterized protein
MNPEQNIRKNLDTLARHDTATFADGYASDAVVDDPAYPEPLRGRDAVRKDIEAFIRAFPDLHPEIRNLVTNDDGSYALEVWMTGTHTGPLALPDGEVPATGRPIKSPMAVFGRCDADGRFVEERRYYDVLGMLTQLGVVPEAQTA